MNVSTTRSTRRRALVWGSLGVFAALAGYWGRRSGIAPSAKSVPAPVALSSEGSVDAVTVDASNLPALSHELYSPLVNTEFTLEIPDHPGAKVRLVEVTAVRKMKAPKADYSAFSLYFEAAEGLLSEGGICRVSHPDLNPMNLFLSPVGRPSHGKILLEAAFTERV